MVVVTWSIRTATIIMLLLKIGTDKRKDGEQTKTCQGLSLEIQTVECRKKQSKHIINNRNAGECEGYRRGWSGDNQDTTGLPQC